MVEAPFYYAEAFWLMVAGVAAAAAAGISAWEAKKSKQSIELSSQEVQLSTRQVEESKKLTELQISSHIFQRITALYEDTALSSGTFVDDMKNFLSSNPQAGIKDLPIASLDYKTAVRKLLSFYEEVGHYIYYHEELKERLLSIVGDEAVIMWEVLSPLIQNERSKFKEPKLYFFCEHLYNEIKKGNP